MDNILQKEPRSSTLSFENIIRGIRMQYILAVATITGTKKVPFSLF